MASDSPSRRTAQLDTEERKHLEGVVSEMRERVKDNVEFRLTQEGLDTEPADRDDLDETTRKLTEEESRTPSTMQPTKSRSCSGGTTAATSATSSRARVAH